MAVHPSQIEARLEEIWESLQGTNKMRACLFNLILYAKKDKRLPYLHTTVQQIIERFPSRVIFITHDDESSDSELQTNVSVLSAEEGQSEIICDLIEIEVSKDNQACVPFIVLPHILPDLPIYFFHADDPSAENPISTELERYARRVIFDSEAAASLPKFAATVLELSEKSPAEVADLNWGRIEGWRQLFANAFKSEDEMSLMRKASEIHIHYNAEATESLCQTRIQAIYLQGWLACQLGWTFQRGRIDEDRLSFSYDTDHLPVRVTLHPSKMSGIQAGRILSVAITTENDYHFKFQRKPDCPDHVLIEKSSPSVCFLPTQYILTRASTGQSLVKEVCHRGTSQHYLRLLRLLKQYDQGGLC